MAKKVLKTLLSQGYRYVDTTYDDDFIYDVFENDYGSRRLFIVGCRQIYKHQLLTATQITILYRKRRFKENGKIRYYIIK